MQRPRVQILLATALFAGLALAVARVAPAGAAAVHDVFVTNPPNAAVQVQVAHADEPFHLSSQITNDQGIDQERVLLVTADRKMVIDHVSGRMIGSPFETANFALELEAPGRKTLAVHEVPLTVAWLYPDNVGVAYEERMRLIASQPMKVIIDVGEKLYFHAQVPYGGTVVSAISVSGHYSPSR